MSQKFVQKTQPEREADRTKFLESIAYCEYRIRTHEHEIEAATNALSTQPGDKKLKRRIRYLKWMCDNCRFSLQEERDSLDAVMNPPPNPNTYITPPDRQRSHRYNPNSIYN